MSSQTFVDRIVSRIIENDRPAIIIADSRFGGPHIFLEIVKREELCIWIKLAPEDKDDPIAQGNSLSDAITKSIGSQLFGHAMPFQYGLSVLQASLATFAPLTIILSNADYGQAFAQGLINLHGRGSRVIIAFEEHPKEFLIPAKSNVIKENDLQLDYEEAYNIADERISEIEVAYLLQISKARYESFLLELHKIIGLPTPLRPGPGSFETPPDANISVPPKMLLQIAIKRSEWLNAFELAIEHDPKQAVAIIDKAAERYFERGLYDRLWQHLESLPDELKENERLIYWQFNTASRVGKIKEIYPKVEKFLAANDSADIRALYANTLSPKKGLRESRKAYNSKKSYVTLLHYANNLLTSNVQKALEIFQELDNMAKIKGSDKKRVVALAGIALSLGVLGRYKEAVEWFNESLNLFNKTGSSDWQLRAYLYTNMSYSRILIGDNLGLDKFLLSEEKALREAFPGLLVAYRNTLGEYYLSIAEAENALAYFQANHDLLIDKNPLKGRDFPAGIVSNLTLALVQLGRLEQAKQLAEKHYFLTRGSELNTDDNISVSIAYGMVLNHFDPVAALQPLKEAFSSAKSIHNELYATWSAIHLAKSYLKLKKKAEARNILNQAAEGLEELSPEGFRLLSGKEDEYKEVHDLWSTALDPSPLKIKFLGSDDVWLNDQPLPLRNKWKEVLCLLALSKDGVSAEKLLLDIYGDAPKMSTLKATVSKLRQMLDITASPYQIKLDFSADFNQLQDYLNVGNIRKALELYQGPLLPFSKAPGVLEARDFLEEAVRQAVINAADVEALVDLAEKLPEDFEVWELCLNKLPKEDPRYALLNAKYKKLKEDWDL